jgi:exodeoxyribonuclease VII large subunit
MLIDFVADYRAPTPTGAAEAVVPTKLALSQELDNMWVRLSGNFMTRLANAKQRMESISIKSPHQFVMEQAQRLDDLGRTMGIIINTKIATARQRMDVVSAFPNIMQNRMAVLNQSVSHLGQMLQSLSYKSVLSRGYAIVRGVDGKIISRSDAGVPHSIEFADGVVQI